MSPNDVSTARAVKALKWELKGTTEPVDRAKRIMERVVDHVPKLAENADRAVINGNPHPTGDLYIGSAIHALLMPLSTTALDSKARKLFIGLFIPHNWNCSSFFTYISQYGI
ncbi:hypothetical protein B7494_g8482 [Chlorociboria aeruginascens]|nr:hypothetical protein B7494_g8482 [Chlorociboria aeruginascens]